MTLHHKWYCANIICTLTGIKRKKLPILLSAMFWRLHDKKSILEIDVNSPILFEIILKKKKKKSALEPPAGNNHECGRGCGKKGASPLSSARSPGTNWLGKRSRGGDWGRAAGRTSGDGEGGRRTKAADYKGLGDCKATAVEHHYLQTFVPASHM